MKRKFIIFLFTYFHVIFFYAQKNDTLIARYQELDDVYTSKSYWNQYNYWLKKCRKVYPLAVYAAEKLHEIDKAMSEVESKRKKKKVGKEANKELRSEFTYVVRDLYTSEGRLLMQLIHRETGMTVAEIITKYRGRFKADIQDNLGKIWDQDLDIKHDPKKDWILENVIKDIKKNKIKDFDYQHKIVTKEEYKESMKQYRLDCKEAKKAMKEKRKASR
ncbi:MAG: DUF4294 domain-containing protein [Flavobacteriia bacterium]|nr:DUF4294 domain-containing protein [Flavobacteriia bacterium]